MSAPNPHAAPTTPVVRTLDGPQATHDLGREIGAAVLAGSLLLVAGEVGAGKTTLAQGVAEGLGVTERVTSPTFVLVREHPVARVSGRPRGLIHVDLYRLTGAAEAEELALGEYLDDGWVVLVEWPDRLPALAESAALTVQLAVAGEGRRAEIAGRGEWAHQVAAALTTPS